MSRVVDPIFADMRWEDGQITWRGCVALVKALALHAATSLPGWCAAVWADDDRAIPRAARFVVFGATLAATLLLIPPTLHVARVPKFLFFFTRAPQALTITLPPAIIIAIPIAFHRRRIGARLLRRTLLLSLLIVAATSVVVSRGMLLLANQSERGMEVYFADGRQMTLKRGSNETTWAALRRQIEDLRQTKDGEGPAAAFEKEYQTRLAITTAPVPLGLAGLAICALPFGRRRPLLVGVIGVFTFWTLITLVQPVESLFVGSGSLLGVRLCAWAPNAILLIAASAILLSRRSLILPPPLSVSRGA
jgi:hypothetical protein